MYNTYLTGSTFIANGSKLPKHKGIVFNTNSAVGGFTGYLVNSTGVTMQAGFFLPAGPSIFPIQFYGIASLATGVTGYLLT